MVTKDVTILLNARTRQAQHDALGLAMTALVAGQGVLIALLGDGLAGWVSAYEGEPPTYGDGPWAPTWRHGFQRLGVPSLSEQVSSCREIAASRFTVVACGGAVELLGLDLEELITTQVVDDVVGLPTIWRRAAGMRLVSF